MAAPMLLAAVPLALGIALGLWAEPPAGAWLLGVLAAAWVGVGAGALARAPGVLVCAVGVAFGAIGLVRVVDAQRSLVAVARGPLAATVTAQGGRSAAPILLEGRIRRDAWRTDRGVALRLDVERARLGGRWAPAAAGVAVGVHGSRLDLRMAAWRAGRHVRLPVTLRVPSRYRNPGVDDQARRLAWQGVDLMGSVKSALLVEIVGLGSVPAELAAAIRARIRRHVRVAVGPFGARSAGIVTAVLIGDRAGLDEPLRRRMAQAGTYHVIAISGGNIAILVGIIVVTLRRARLPPVLVSLTTAAVVVAYAYLVGREASVARAAATAAVVLVARAADHRTSSLNALALAGAMMLVVVPHALVDVGFMLTYVATLGLVLGAASLYGTLCQLVSAVLGPRGSWLFPAVGLLSATLCAEVVLSPIAAQAFSRISVAGVALNFLAIPLMTLVQIGGLMTVAVAEVWTGLSVLPGYLTHLAAVGLVESAGLVELAPWLARRIPPPSVGHLIAYYSTLMVAWSHPSARVRRAAGRILIVLVAWLLLSPAPALRHAVEAVAGSGDRHEALRVAFLDVGQADAVLVQLPGGGSLLVDAAGPPGAFDLGERVVAPALWALGVRRLDYLALTHGDPDHIGGAGAVARDFRPREIWEGVPVESVEPMRRLGAWARDRGSAWRILQAGDRMRVGQVAVNVWHPPAPDWERPQPRNDDSLVLELRIGDVSIVLPGDVGATVEAQVAQRALPVPIRVLKVPHHGSRSSSSVELIEALAPDVAVVSAGRANPYGHPAPEVIRRYRDAGAVVFRTDVHGAVLMETDGRRLRVRTMSGRALDLVADR